MKIGIMGGTFDPIHNGHLMLGEYAHKLFALDEIWFMPNGNPPHKSGASIESLTISRVEMVKRAIRDYKYFALELYEVKNKEISYSYKTMQHFQSEYPEHDFYFIIGADSLFSIESWVKPEQLFKTCTILAAYRDGKNTSEMLSQIHYLMSKYGCDIRLLNTPNMDISSSEIRRRIKNGLPIREFVPESVLKYIEEEQLFKDDAYESIEN